jgi:hypothetical protein
VGNISTGLFRSGFAPEQGCVDLIGSAGRREDSTKGVKEVRKAWLVSRGDEALGEAEGGGGYVPVHPWQL